MFALQKGTPSSSIQRTAASAARVLASAGPPLIFDARHLSKQRISEKSLS